MTLTIKDVKKIAHLARLNVEDANLEPYTQQLSHILSFVEQMNTVDTTEIEPMAHALELSQRLRPDMVTESNQREEFQKIAPLVKAGLYLVPKVIDAE